MVRECTRPCGRTRLLSAKGTVEENEPANSKGQDGFSHIFSTPLAKIPHDASKAGIFLQQEISNIIYILFICANKRFVVCFSLPDNYI
jgi:hypothetical protein